jgi:hypothetical protein
MSHAHAQHEQHSLSRRLPARYAADPAPRMVGLQAMHQPDSQIEIARQKRANSIKALFIALLSWCALVPATRLRTTWLARE